MSASIWQIKVNFNEREDYTCLVMRVHHESDIYVNTYNSLFTIKQSDICKRKIVANLFRVTVKLLQEKNK